MLDFGLAQVDQKPEIDDQKLTQHGCALGSPLYMSPEQCQGKPVDARSDIYSFGCLMYEVLKGSPPFRGDSAFDTMNLHVHHRPPQLDDFVTSPSLRSVIGRCLAKTPEERFASAQDITRELNAVTA
ncbi:MAG: protein kinase [Candidatus Melainabacteria bacterium]|nr:protein kinase [Candidatus Melainabacteria bacterium]